VLLRGASGRRSTPVSSPHQECTRYEQGNAPTGVFGGFETTPALCCGLWERRDTDLQCLAGSSNTGFALGAGPACDLACRGATARAGGNRAHTQLARLADARRRTSLGARQRTAIGTGVSGRSLGALGAISGRGIYLIGSRVPGHRQRSEQKCGEGYSDAAGLERDRS
jgi:hypothetical protein